MHSDSGKYCPLSLCMYRIQDHYSYTRLCLPFIVRKRLSQLRLGVLPLRIESDRYCRVKVDAKDRFCKQPKCENNCATTPLSKFDVENDISLSDLL